MLPAIPFMPILIRAAVAADVASALKLFPRLAAFELPKARVANHLWESDARMLLRWAEGNEPQCRVQVAVEEGHHDTVLGVAMITLRKELLSHEPSAHLEALVVAAGTEGRGIGRRLVDAAEHEAKANGARSMTLHVFGSNARARGLYRRLGFDEELLRCIKHFD